MNTIVKSTSDSTGLEQKQKPLAKSTKADDMNAKQNDIRSSRNAQNCTTHWERGFVIQHSLSELRIFIPAGGLLRGGRVGGV